MCLGSVIRSSRDRRAHEGISLVRRGSLPMSCRIGRSVSSRPAVDARPESSCSCHEIDGAMLSLFAFMKAPGPATWRRSKVDFRQVTCFSQRRPWGAVAAYRHGAVRHGAVRHGTPFWQDTPAGRHASRSSREPVDHRVEPATCGGQRPFDLEQRRCLIIIARSRHLLGDQADPGGQLAERGRDRREL